MTDKVYLKKNKIDFQAEGKEAPEELIHNDDTLGAVMTDHELNEWLIETEKVFLILSEKNKTTFKRLYREYVLEIDYLLELKRIDKEQAKKLKDLERFKF